MSFSSRRRNYLLTPHRRDGLIEWMKSMLNHSFVLDALGTTGADTFSHFELLIEEHRQMNGDGGAPSRLKQLVPTVGTFHTALPLRKAFEAYNKKHNLTKRRHVCISFNEIRHILNLAQIMAMREVDDDDNNNDSDENLNSWVESTRNVEDLEKGSETFNGPKMITFDGDQTLYSDGANFESNPRLANYLYLLLKHGVTVAVVTAAGYEYNTEKYELRLSGLLAYFRQKKLSPEDCERFYLFGGECNYLLKLGSDYTLHAVRETGPGGWCTSTRYIAEAPANWSDQDVKTLLDTAEQSVKESLEDQNLRSRIIRKKRSIGLVPKPDSFVPREGLDEAVLRVQAELASMNGGKGPPLPFCAFNGGRDVWVDVGNKRVGVQILQSYLGIPTQKTIHVGDQFLNTGNDYLARSVCPCIWITGPEETTYILKSILRLAGIDAETAEPETLTPVRSIDGNEIKGRSSTQGVVDFTEVERRKKTIQLMDVYTGEIVKSDSAGQLQV